MGPFDEEDSEEGTGVASNVVQVEGENQATPGPLKRNNPGTVTIPQYRGNETKQNTQMPSPVIGLGLPNQRKKERKTNVNSKGRS